MTRHLTATGTRLGGVLVLERSAIQDARGWFERLFCERELGDAIAGRRIVQVNRTMTRRTGSVRGLHYQEAPHAEMKLVTCLRGAIFDVAVDLRRGSSTFLSWHGEVLSGANAKTLVIPEGCAHGFQTLADDCELLYLHTTPYEPTAERALNAADPRIAIAWPLAIGERSDRDARAPMLTDAFEGVPA